MSVVDNSEMSKKEEESAHGDLRRRRGGHERQIASAEGSHQPDLRSGRSGNMAPVRSPQPDLRRWRSGNVPNVPSAVGKLSTGFTALAQWKRIKYALR